MAYPDYKHTVRLMQNLLLTCMLIVLSFGATAQKYSFSHYDIEDGLTQSQVSPITQDISHHLIVATKLGIGRFDGKTFTSITKENGLPDNVVTAITTDSKGRIWCGSLHGLYYYDAGKIHLQAAKGSNLFTDANVLLTDNKDRIWGIKNNALFNIADGVAKSVTIAGAKNKITAIANDVDGNILAAVSGKGIYGFKNDKWALLLPLPGFKIGVRQILPDDKQDARFFILTDKEILYAKNNFIPPLDVNYPSRIKYPVNYICRDAENGLWIGTSIGAYHLDLLNNKLKYFNEANGFTSNAINYIFRDIDNNIWFGTNGSGMYRFNGGNFVSFSQSQKFSDPNIMQLTRDVNGNILLASSGMGLFTYDGRDITKIEIPSKNPLTRKVFCLAADNNKNIWIGTLYGGLWKKTGRQITLAYPLKKSDPPLLFSDIKKDAQQTMWFATSTGCYYLGKDNTLVKVLNANCRSLLVLGRDSVLVATSNEILLLKNKKPDNSFKAWFLKESFIMCISYFKGRIYAGTVDNGLFVWNPVTGRVARLNKKNGLSANSVYSMGIDRDSVLWVGTGRGINKFKIKGDEFKRIPDDDLSNLVTECNQNSLAFFNDEVWIGTTRGLVVLKHRESSGSMTAPYTVIQTVHFLDKHPVNYIYQNGYKIPAGLQLPFDNSHIMVHFKGIDLKNPDGVLYSYRLAPVDSGFSPPSKNDFVEYPSLPPDKYVFYVKSLVEGGRESNTARFTFEIEPAYYQTVIFKIVVGLLCILAGFAIVQYYKTKNRRKRKMIEDLRLEEQVKIRKQTAEDFHDDLGNKLTRINVLSDILYKSVSANSPEDGKLVHQIKENADALFTGSKYILWALEPDNDQLSQVLNHISEFGSDMFLNTNVNFLPQIPVNAFSQVVLPMGHGRNIIMIFKELFNNALKHAEAKNVILSAKVDEGKNICIAVEDDGRGFDPGKAKNGNGTRNINNRSKKVNGQIKLNSIAGNGTRVTLVLKGYSELF